MNQTQVTVRLKNTQIKRWHEIYLLSLAEIYQGS